ncbi:MAG: DUF1553 domain-containing protein, partial [Planctomycetales bacterium]|nr:DUF1553 domain-containing protein [Planctomycetales bacterium]
LPAWMIRDTRLALSGQLRRELGGPPVYPYQPPGVWKDQFMGRLSYQPTMGSGQYRRTLYAFWRRTSAPTFLFDSAMRRSCEVTVQRTNTPLHALTLLNDLTGQEVARTLADRFALDPQLPSVDDQLHALWRHALGREASSQEAKLLSTQYNQACAFYAQHAADAGELLSIGQLAPPSDERLAERAALMVVATLVLNLDEAITHE